MALHLCRNALSVKTLRVRSDSHWRPQDFATTLPGRGDILETDAKHSASSFAPPNVTSSGEWRLRPARCSACRYSQASTCTRREQPPDYLALRRTRQLNSA